MRLALADDSGIFRHSLCRSLEEVGATVVINAGSATELLGEMNLAAEIDAAVVDVAMPETQNDRARGPGSNNEGVVAAREIRIRYPWVGILLLSAYAATPQAIQLLRDFDRSIGYLSKNDVADTRELHSALERIMRGEMVVDRSLVTRLLRAPSRGRELSALTGQERQVLNLMAEGFSNYGISQRLHLATRTIEDHVHRIFFKLNIGEPASRDENRRVLAVLTWLRFANETD